jgi:antitoxin MazE
MKSTAMRSTVRKMGNSAGVIIPESLLAEIGAKAGDDVDMVVETGRLIIVPSRANPRAGWADDARRLAEAGDDAPAWPEFGNADDDRLEW